MSIGSVRVSALLEYGVPVTGVGMVASMCVASSRETAVGLSIDREVPS
jgi:hypothetical protein